MIPARFPFIAAASLTTSLTFAEAPVDFVHDVAPILREHCAKCHMESARKGGFSLNTREDLTHGSENGPVLEEGNAEHSLLFEVIISDDKTERMPPKGPRVSENQVAILRRWIDQGAKWEPGFTFAKNTYEPPLLPREPKLPPAVDGRNHPIDRIIDDHLRRNQVQHPAPLDDLSFLRRTSLDLIGILPTPEEIETFSKDTSPDKRQRWIDQLLARDHDYAAHWISLWNDLLRNDYQGTGYIDGGRKSITRWLYQSLVTNKPYDAFTRELISPPNDDSRGFIDGIQWRGNVNASQTREIQFSQSVSQTFLGLNMKCASCHDSFIDRWKLDEAYGLAAIYATQPIEIARCDKPTGRFAKASWIFPEIGEIDPDAPQPERLRQLAGLMTHPDNGRYTRTIVNRLWQRLMGRGIVHPVDAMDTEPWNEDLLDALAQQFVKDGYDLRKALRFIATSSIYQSASLRPASAEDLKNFRAPLARRMSAEQWLDAVWSITRTTPEKPDPSVPPIHPPAALQPATSRWIWSSSAGSISSNPGDAITLGIDFQLPATATKGFISFIADNEAEIYLNGIHLVSETFQPAGPRVVKVDLPPTRTGKNWLIAVVRNRGEQPNPVGFRLEGKIELADGSTHTLHTDQNWRWTSSLPDIKGQFTTPPLDWKPAETIATDHVWSRWNDEFTASLTSTKTPAVRASLVSADLLMRALGRPNREQIVSMRPEDITTLEAIDLSNGQPLADLVRRGATYWTSQNLSSAELLDQLFLEALTRKPTPSEREALLPLLRNPKDSRSVEDLIWTVIMLPEFHFIR